MAAVAPVAVAELAVEEEDVAVRCGNHHEHSSSSGSPEKIEDV